MKKRTVFCFY